jgi:23S rRNA (adenine1618-N6)-methyltransferase
MPAFHPRNRHQGRYDIAKLVEADPSLERWLTTTPRGEQSIDFSQPDAVKSLNRALLASYYGVRDWDFPEGFLCPPIPGRADLIHHIADLLASLNDGTIPRGDRVQAIDIGVGASCIYPLIGRAEYGWRFLGSDIDPQALKSSEQILLRNPTLAAGIELRLQPSRRAILKELLRPGEQFDVVVCNPPFHASAEEAEEASRRKWRNLGHASDRARNFGGGGFELWCPGGELAFAERMIQESIPLARDVFWFSILISKESNLPLVYQALKRARVVEQRTVKMEQGQKTSRFVAWSFCDFAQQRAWCERRFKQAR